MPRNARAQISLLLLARTPDISARDISRFRNRSQKTGLAVSGGSSDIPRPVISLTLGRPYQRQLLEDVLAPGRTRRGTRLNADEIKQRYVNSGFYDPVPTLLAAKDSLLLTADQAARLSEIGKRYTAATDSIWRELGAYLAALDSQYDEHSALRRTHEAKLEAYAELEAAAREMNAILSPEQMHFLAPEIQAMLDVRTIEQMRRRELESY